LLGLTQTSLAKELGVQFQQVQKYECSAARISAARLYRLAAVLKVPVDYFFASLPPVVPFCAADKDRTVDSVPDLLADKETLNFLNSYAKLPVSVRQRLRTFAKSLGEVIGERAGAR
jgi:transcriptional regulator with XRE-family HTH domain